jgi:hypothetical protein
MMSPTKSPISSPTKARPKKTIETRLSDIRIHGDVAYVTLTQGYVATIDRADVARVSRYNWYAFPRRHAVYAMARIPGNASDTRISLHRFIAARDDDLDIDHKDGDGLNNRRRNLRPATRLQQAMNRSLRGGGSNAYRGARWVPKRNKWVAKITIEGKVRYIGHYDTEQEAARAYQYVARRVFGEFYRGAPAELPEDAADIRISPLVRSFILPPTSP